MKKKPDRYYRSFPVSRYDNHHRRPKSQNGDDSKRNVVRVLTSKHRAYHQIFQNKLPKEVAKILTDTWIDPDYYMVAIPRKKSVKKTVCKGKRLFTVIVIEEEGNLDILD